MSLPLWKCHKVVRAAKILEIRQGEASLSEPCYLILDCDETLFVSPEWAREKRVEVGGYFVQYEDGYQSYSPAKAFEDGYTRIEDGGPR